MPGLRRRRFVVPSLVTRLVTCLVNRQATCQDVRLRFCAVACLLMFTAAVAWAQTPLHVRGTLVEFAIWSGQAPLILRAKARDGSDIAVEVAFNWEAYPIAEVDRANVVDGSYVGVVAVPAGDGALRARAVLLYPEHLRGTLMGHHPWDSAPGSTMTTATRVWRVAGGDGETWTRRDAQGEHAIRVGGDVPFVTTGIGGHNYSIAAGAPVFVNATRQRDGTITAGRIFYGEHGFVPPL